MIIGIATWRPERTLKKGDVAKLISCYQEIKFPPLLYKSGSILAPNFIF